MRLKAGRLRHRINIQTFTQAQDPVTGAVTATWATIHENVPCAIEPLSVKDYMQSQAVQSDVKVRVVFRYLPNLEPSMRFVGTSGAYLGEIFNPEGFFEDPESGRSYITAPCSRGVNDGDL